jgi:hypothetical protein
MRACRSDEKTLDCAEKFAAFGILQDSTGRWLIHLVIPAKAGIQIPCLVCMRSRRNWIPAFAGMTNTIQATLFCSKRQGSHQGSECAHAA